MEAIHLKSSAAATGKPEIYTAHRTATATNVTKH
jgi:hypothetical protein